MRLLIVGGGRMGSSQAKEFAAIPGVTLAGIVESDADRRDEFRTLHKIDAGYATVEEALAVGDFDAVTNVTPDAAHFATTMPVLAAGKHVLCEKPLATNHTDALRMALAAADAGVINMVNLTYRGVSALQAARKLIASGAIGEVRHVEASYLQSWLTQPAWGDWQTESVWLWRLSTAHGSAGVLGDIGVHILDFASYATGMSLTSVGARLHTFDKAPGGRIGEYVLDANDSFVLTGSYENGALASIHASRFASGHLNDLTLRVFGTKGGVEITNAGKLGTMRTCLGVDLEKAVWTEVSLTPVPTNYARFAQAVASGTPADPGFAHAARLQASLDAALVSDTEGRVVAVG